MAKSAQPRARVSMIINAAPADVFMAFVEPSVVVTWLGQIYNTTVATRPAP